MKTSIMDRLAAEAIAGNQDIFEKSFRPAGGRQFFNNNPFSITPDRDLSAWKFELLREANGERITGLENPSPHTRSVYTM